MQRCVGKFSPKDDSKHSVAIPSGLKYVKKIASSDTLLYFAGYACMGRITDHLTAVALLIQCNCVP